MKKRNSAKAHIRAIYPNGKFMIEVGVIGNMDLKLLQKRGYSYKERFATSLLSVEPAWVKRLPMNEKLAERELDFLEQIGCSIQVHRLKDNPLLSVAEWNRDLLRPKNKKVK